jgi:hypothetical protein
MSLVIPLAGMISGMVRRAYAFLRGITAEQWAWMSLFGSIGVIFFVGKNVLVAGMSKSEAILFLIPMIPVKFITGYIFAPLRNRVLAHIQEERRFIRWVTKCFIYAVDMTAGWAVIGIFCVKWELFPWACFVTFGTSFAIASPVEYVQGWLQAKFESSAAFFPLLGNK